MIDRPETRRPAISPLAAIVLIAVLAAGCGGGPDAAGDDTDAPHTTAELTLDDWAVEAQQPVEDLVDALTDYYDALDPTESGNDDLRSLACDVLLDRVNRYDDLIRSAPEPLTNDAVVAMTALRTHARTCPNLFSGDDDVLDDIRPLVEATSRAGLDLSPTGN
jgi:hypothetical protein